MTYGSRLIPALGLAGRCLCAGDAIIRRLLCVALCLLCSTACTQKMARQPKYGPLAPSEFFGDRQSSRPAVPGTVARGDERIISPDLSVFKSGEAYVENIPLPLTPQLVERGRERYEIYCAACHGHRGEGDGPVSGTLDYRFPPPLSFYADEVRARPAGFYFDVMTNGYQAMGRYAHQLSARDRWAIIAYIRELQQLHPHPSNLEPEGRH